MQRTLRQPGFWLACGLVAVTAGCQMALTIPLEVVDMVLRERGSEPLRLIREPFVLGVVNLIALGTAVAVGLLVNRMGLRRAFPLGGISGGAWGALVVIGVGAAIVFSELDNLVRWVLPPPQFIREMMGDIFMARDKFASLFFTAVIVAPVAEELLFRGIILRGLLGRFKPWMAISLSAMLFALMHMNPWQTVPQFGLGLVLGWFYLRTRSLWPCIAGHALNNLLFVVAVCAPFGLWEPLTAEDYAVVEFQPWWFDVTGVCVLASGVWWFRKNSTPLPVILEPPLPPVLPPENVPPSHSVMSAQRMRD
jgi:membrane protease YdiL (CAAX protease family)